MKTNDTHESVSRIAGRGLVLAGLLAVALALTASSFAQSNAAAAPKAADAKAAQPSASSPSAEAQKPRGEPERESRSTASGPSKYGTGTGRSTGTSSLRMHWLTMVRHCSLLC